MSPVRDFEPFARRDACRGGRFDPAEGRFRGWRAHSSLRRHELPPGHPEVGQREQRVQLGGVLRQSAVANLGVAELALDHPERMLDLGADARLDVFHLRGDRVSRIARVEQPAQSGSQRDMPVRADVLRVLALVDALVAGIGEHDRFLAMDKRVCLGHVVDVGRGAHHRVHQPAVGIDADVDLHAEMPLVALLGLVHAGLQHEAGHPDRRHCTPHGSNQGLRAFLDRVLPRRRGSKLDRLRVPAQLSTVWSQRPGAFPHGLAEKEPLSASRNGKHPDAQGVRVDWVAQVAVHADRQIVHL